MKRFWKCILHNIYMSIHFKKVWFIHCKKYYSNNNSIKFPQMLFVWKVRNRRHWDRVWWDSLLMAPHVWVDPSGSKWILAHVSYDSKRDMCSRVQLIFKNHPDLYVPINPIFIYKIRCNDSISDTTFKVQCTRTHVPWVRTKKT